MYAHLRLVILILNNKKAILLQALRIWVNGNDIVCT